VLHRHFTADAPNQTWAGDITYIWTREGRLYLAALSDLYFRRVIGWAAGNRMNRDLALWALKMVNHCPAGDVWHHRVSVLVKLDFASIFSGPEAVRWP